VNILVVNGYVRQNKGDAALMSVLCQELQKSFPQATVRISSQENPRHFPIFEEWENIGSFNQYCFDPATGKLRHLLRLLLSGSVIAVLSYVPDALHNTKRFLPGALRAQLAALAEADLVVSMGGGYLNGDASLMAQACVYLMLAPLKLGKHFGACVVCAPQSMGPFATKFQKMMVTDVLEKVDLVLTREPKTTKLLAEMSAQFPVVQSVDSGFLFESHEPASLRNRLRIGNSTLLVGTTVRRWLDPKRQRSYELAIAKTVDHLVSHHNATVVFIPQVTSSLGGDDDRATAQSVYADIAHKDHVFLLDLQYTHQQIKSLYSELDIIIGTRFHSVIFSLTSFVPALAIEYEHKTSGIMHDLALDEWVVKIEEATPEILRRKIDDLITASKQYKRHLKKVLPGYAAEARKAMELIVETYKA
jgi:colanic acid/amylovoran biosynthesis protein